MIRTVLFDLDGVIRHFDPAHVRDIERRHGLADGSIHAAAFAPDLLDAVTTGGMTRAAWIIAVGDRLGHPVAAGEWGRHPATVDDRMLSLNDELRTGGIRTAILTNGTDTIDDELRDHGIDGRFDAVFNSAVIGFAKPDVRAFQHVLDALGLAPEEVFFTDDSAAKLAGARTLGIATHHFTGMDALRSALRAVGVPQAAMS